MGKILLVTALVCISVFLGCASKPAVSPSVDDILLETIKTNTTEKVSFEYTSRVTDGKMPWLGKNKEPLTGTAITHSESAAFGRLVSNYISNKFTAITPNGTTQIKVSLEDFYVQLYSDDNADIEMLFGNDANYEIVATVNVVIIVVKENTGYSRKFGGSSSRKNTAWHGHKTSPNDTPVEMGSEKEKLSKCINEANAQILIEINDYLEGLGL